MIVKESEANAYICPIISFQHKNSTTAEHCRGKICMAWRETYKDHGFCGMTNTGNAYTSKEDRQLQALWRTEDDV